MRAVHLILLLALAGCASWSKPLPKQPEAPTDGGVIVKVGTQMDKVDGRVAAAVTVARENADKPGVVKAETGVALSYLPQPSEGDLAIAKARAAKADQKDYAAAEAAGKKAMESLKADLAKAKADQVEAKRVSDMKDTRIKELERKLTDSDNMIWTIAGIALVVIGGVIWWLLKDAKGAMTISGLGLIVGAYPRVMDSPWFLWIAVGSLGFLALLGLWWAFDKVRDDVNKP